MTTTKKRTNLCLDDTLDKELTLLATRDGLPKAAKAVELIRIAIELDEDSYWLQLVETREKRSKKYISHEQAWS